MATTSDMEGRKTMRGRIADTIRSSDNHLVRASLAEEVLGFLRSRDETNFKRLPAFEGVDAAWCDLLLETHTYNEICIELFGFVLHRDKQWVPEILPTTAMVHHDTVGVPVYYRSLTTPASRRFDSKPNWERVLPRDVMSPEDTIPYIVRAFGKSLGDAPRQRILAREVLGFLKLKVVIGDVHPLYHISPPADVDQGWHALIMQTKLYEELCGFLLQTLGNQNGLDSNNIIHHSMYQEGEDEGRQMRLANTHDALMRQLCPKKRKNVTLNVEMADWVGYDIPTGFALLL